MTLCHRQAGLRSIWEKYYAEAHAVMYVVDGEAAGRVDEARGALQRALASRELDGAPVLIVANKSDIAGAEVGAAVQAWAVQA